MDKAEFFGLSFVIVLFDQLIKYYVSSGKPALSFFHYVTNTGAAFGLFNGGNFILAALTLIVVCAIIYLYLYRPEQFKERYIAVSASLILGGALGNLIDRIESGYVIDYIDIGFWPVFNLADIALSMGVIILLFCCWDEKKKR